MKHLLYAGACVALSATLLTACSKDDNSNNGEEDMTSPYNNQQLPDMDGEADGDMSGDMSEEPALALEFVEIDLGEEVTAMTELAFLPGSSTEFLLLRKSGEVLHFELDGDSATRKGSFTIEGVDDGADCGLISMAFDPDFETNRYAYFGYCTELGVNKISRHELDLEDTAQIMATRAEIISVENPDAQSRWHNVGAMAFDDEGHLWALFGENANGPDAQDLSRPTGSLVQIIPNRAPDGEGYEPAPDNPFLDDAEKHDAIFAWGLRSPWRGVLDAEGRFWLGDVGASRIEEVNVATAPGQNFGWPDEEGPCQGECDGLTDPLINWNREPDHPFVFDDVDTAPTDRRAAWVGLAYRDNAQDRYDGLLTGKVLYGDFCTGWVRAASMGAENNLTSDAHVAHLEGVVSWSQAADGHAYVATYGNCQTFPYKPGKIYRAELAR